MAPRVRTPPTRAPHPMAGHHDPVRVVVRTPDGKVWAYPGASAAIDTSGTLVVRDACGRRLAVYPAGRAESFELRSDDDQR